MTDQQNRSILNGAHEKERIAACKNLAEWDALRVELLGKNGRLTQELKTLGSCPPEERRSRGSTLNALREDLETALAVKKDVLDCEEAQEKMQKDRVDVTLPCRPQPHGGFHLLSQIACDLIDYFQARGYEVFEGPEIDSERNNFEILNVPEHHPARQDQDTLYIKGFPGQLLRTQTTAVQSRTLLGHGVPVRGITIGSVFRNDAVDATHAPMFHQLDWFVVEPGVSMAHLNAFVLDVMSFLFQRDLSAQAARGDPIPVRFRPSFFPFTEPSLEVDCRCSRQNGELKLDMDGDWMEILGCGMIHPNVFKNCGLSTFEDGTPLQGFAGAFGIERIAMLKYGITDIRQFYENDQRWLQHYGRK